MPERPQIPILLGEVSYTVGGVAQGRIWGKDWMDMMRSVGTLTRADLAETINRKMGLSRAESLDMVEAILGKM